MDNIYKVFNFWNLNGRIVDVKKVNSIFIIGNK